jgi:uncharacterized protein YjbJ (UPF0337 family)
LELQRKAQDNIMPNADEIKGKAREIGGSVQEKVGRAKGDPEMEDKGTANRARGKVQGVAGKVKRNAKVAKDKITG